MGYFRSIRGKIILGQVPAIVLLPVIIAVSYYFAHAAISKDRSAMLRLMTQNGEMKVSHMIEGCKTSVVDWSRNYAEPFGMGIEFGNTGELVEVLNRLQEQNFAISMLVITDEDGAAVQASARGIEDILSLITASETQHHEIEILTSGEELPATVLSLELASLRTAPAEDGTRTSKPIGAVNTIAFRFETLDTTGEANGWVIALLDWQGVDSAVSTIHASLVEQGLPDAYVTVRTQDSDKDLSKVGASAPNGVSLFHASRKIESCPSIALAISVPSSTVLAEAWAILEAGTLIGLGITMVLLGMGWWSGRRISRPVVEVAETLRRISGDGGDLTGRIKVTTRDEVGELATSFNSFVSGLQTMLLQVRESTGHIDEETQSIDVGSHQVQNTAGRQEALIGEARENAAELQASFGQAAQAANSAREFSEVAMVQTEQGVQRVKRSVAMMDAVGQASTKVMSSIESVKAIAFKTNLLALNAAVEAARAGDHGKGFSVVAGEVRALAKSSAEAASEIGALIKVAVDESARGTTSLGELQETLLEIAAGSQEIKNQLEQVNTAAQKQSSCVTSISTCFGDVDQIGKDNSASSERLAAQSSRAADEVRTLRDLIGTFQL